MKMKLRGCEMMEKNEIPKDSGLDHSISLLKEGYEYISNRLRNFQTDVFEARMLGKKVICIAGKEAAELFYDSKKFQRQDTAPNRLMQTLIGKNSVQTLDGAEHRHRKRMFLNALTEEKTMELLDITKLEWEKALDRWEKKTEIVFYEEIKSVLCRSAFKWIGYPIHEEKEQQYIDELSAMFETPASIGPTHWVGRNKRNRAEKKIEELVVKVRAGNVQVQKDSILNQFIFHKDLEGNVLDVETTAVEIINILRPVVAISIYICFIAMALAQFPHERVKLKKAPGYGHLFIQEVRRYYPFFPFIVAKTKTTFSWKGYTFKEGELVLLDIYGTNRDPNSWESPDEFQPERFASWHEDRFSFIPQGGGNDETNHRCPGEHLTVEVMELSLDYLLNKMDYEIPEQDMYIDMSKIPCIPESKVILKNVKRKRESYH